MIGTEIIVTVVILFIVFLVVISGKMGEAETGEGGKKAKGAVITIAVLVGGTLLWIIGAMLSFFLKIFFGED